jgi:hypothetical protein
MEGRHRGVKVLKIIYLSAHWTSPSSGAPSGIKKHLAGPLGISEKISIFAQFYMEII